MGTFSETSSARLTIKQIAMLADVSRSTVSRVVNGHPNVHPDVRRRVQALIVEHGYVPHSAARSLVRRRTDLIGYLIEWNAAADPFLRTIAEGISDTLSGSRYSLMLTMVPGHMRQNFVDRILRGRLFDGLIMALGDVNDMILPFFHASATPLVLIDRHPTEDRFHSVHAANRDGARTAVGHLIALGHRRVATITGPLTMASAQDRLAGFEDALGAANLHRDDTLIDTGSYLDGDSGYHAMRRLLAHSPRPTAVFAANDLMAIGAIRAARDAGLGVPGDLAVVGFDDLPFAAAADPPLTTINQSGLAIGATAARQLLDQIEGHNAMARHIQLPTKLVIRRSCGSSPERRDLTADVHRP